MHCFHGNVRRIQLKLFLAENVRKYKFICFNMHGGNKSFKSLEMLNPEMYTLHAVLEN